MKMRRSGATRAASAPDDRAALDACSDFDIETRQMRVMGRDAASVRDDYHVSITVIPAGECDYARQACADRVAPTSLDVHPRMELRPTSERIAPVTESTSKVHARCSGLLLLVFRFIPYALCWNRNGGCALLYDRGRGRNHYSLRLSYKSRFRLFGLLIVSLLGILFFCWLVFG